MKKIVPFNLANTGLLLAISYNRSLSSQQHSFSSSEKTGSRVSFSVNTKSSLIHFPKRNDTNKLLYKLKKQFAFHLISLLKSQIDSVKSLKFQAIEQSKQDRLEKLKALDRAEAEKDRAEAERIEKLKALDRAEAEKDRAEAERIEKLKALDRAEAERIEKLKALDRAEAERIEKLKALDRAEALQREIDRLKAAQFRGIS